MKRLTKLVLLLAVTAVFTGCSSMTDHFIDCEIKCRNTIIAQKAWNEWSWCYDELDHPFNFAKGFKAGYLDILNGGKGCQPTLPPKCYWKPSYHGPEGQCMVDAWFNGFSHGALAAQQDGYGNISQIPVSPTCRMNLRMASAPPQANVFPVAQPMGSLPMGTDPGMGTSGGSTGGDYNDNYEGTDDTAVPLRPYE
ncbi:MAG: hypothetical protein R3C19_26275 [Planctomycetaceae bacterium]